MGQRSIVLAVLLAAAGCASEGSGNGAGGGAGGTGSGGSGIGGSGGAGGVEGTGGTGGEICTPRTCDEADASCGVIDDGCGRPLECGSCVAPETCGGGGVANRCGCTSETDEQLCERIGASCGAMQAADACGVARTMSSCGTCDDGLVCGGQGTPGACTAPPLWAREYPAATEDLLAVWSFGPNDAWVVGRNGIAAHHDGNSLAVVPTDTRATLVDVWASSGTDIWAVGEKGTLLRRAGGSWRQVVTGFTSDFVSVAGLGPADVWVLAREGTESYFVHGDGLAWSRVDPPLLEGEQLNRIRAIGVDLWAAGSGGLVLRWDGQNWDRLSADASTEFTALGGIDGDVWAAGGTTVFRHDSEEWSSVPADSSWQASAVAIDLWGDATTGSPWLLLGGTSTESVYRVVDPHASMIRWSGTELPFTGSNAIHGSGAGDVWVVGDAGRVATYDGTSFQRAYADAPDCEKLVVADSKAWAICNDRLIFERSATGSWRELPRLTQSMAYVFPSIFAEGPEDLWALAYFSEQMLTRVLHWDGTSWTTYANLYNSLYNAIMVTPEHIALVGAGGKLALHDRPGGAWPVYSAFTGTHPLVGTVHGSTAWVIGSNRLLGRIDAGGDWTKQTGSSTYNDIFAFDAQNVYAVGDGGQVAKWDGSEWLESGFDVPCEAGIDCNLTDVWVSSPTSVWAVAGTSGNLLHWDGTAWTLMEPSERPPGLKATAILPSGEMLGVGRGMLLHR